MLLVLVLLNLWYWSLDRKISESNTDKPYVSAFSKEIFKVNYRHLSLKREREVVRDLFNLEETSTPKQRQISHRKKLNDKQRQKVIAKRELNNYTLAGIIIRNKKREGFLINGKNSYRVTVGGRVGGRFVVKRVTEDAVYLFDPATKVSREIRLSGY